MVWDAACFTRPSVRLCFFLLTVALITGVDSILRLHVVTPGIAPLYIRYLPSFFSVPLVSTSRAFIALESCRSLWCLWSSVLLPSSNHLTHIPHTHTHTRTHTQHTSTLHATNQVHSREPPSTGNHRSLQHITPSRHQPFTPDLQAPTQL